MADFFFFTDVDLLSDIGGSGANQQSQLESFGPQSSTSFRLNSIHKSNSSTDPNAYAVVNGRILIVPVSNTHVNLILFPENSNKIFSKAELPEVKYYIYRNILRNSIFVAGSSPEILQPLASTTNDLVKKIRQTYRSTTDEPTVTEFMPTGANTELLSKEFDEINHHTTIDSGKQIGKFDPNGFSFEIVLNNDDFHPDINFAKNDFDSQSIYSPTFSSTNPSDNFTERHKKEYILNFIDPCAFYGNFFFKGIKAKNSDGNSIATDPTILISGDDRNVLIQVLKKFKNNDKAYIDIRNENNFSFNYYGFVNDAANKDYYSIYSDQLIIDFINNGGTNANANINYYGQYNWPLLIVNNSQFNQTNDKTKNIVGLKLPVGNNSRPFTFLSVGLVDNGSIDSSIKYKEPNEESRFKELKLQNGSSNFDAFNIVIPNDVSNANTKIIPTYTRLKFIRKIALVNPFEIPANTDVQFLDNIFIPLRLKDITPNGTVVKKSVYENERYVCLTEVDQLSKSDYIATTGIAEDNNNITLFCYPLSEKKISRGSRSKHPSEITSEGDQIDDFINLFNNKIDTDKNKNIVIESLDLSPNPIDIVYFNRSGGGHIFKDKRYDNVIMFIIDKNNYNNSVIGTINTSITNNVFSPDLDISLVVKGQTHRDQDSTNDTDSSPSKNKFSKCSLFLKGFKLNGNNIDIVEVDTGIKLYSKLEGDIKVFNVFKDKDAILNTTDTDFSPFTCNLFLNTARPSLDITPINTTVSNNQSDFQISNFNEFLENLYYDDLVDFITCLYKASIDPMSPNYSSISCNSGIQRFDKTSEKLYKYVFSKFILTAIDSFTPILSSNKVQLKLSADNKLITNETKIHQGLLVEGSNYFAVWKITQSLKKIVDVFDEIKILMATPSSAKNRFLPRCNYITKNYTLVNNLVEALRKAGIPSVKDILNSGKDINVTNLQTHFKRIFVHNNTGGQSGILGILKDFYGNYNSQVKDGKSPLYCNTLNNAIEDFNIEKQKYIEKLTECVYHQLGGTLSTYALVNIAIGDSSTSTGLFGTYLEDNLTFGGDGILLFNYQYEGCDNSIANGGDTSLLKTKTSTLLPTLSIDTNDDKPYEVHFGVWGIDGLAPSRFHTVKIRREGADVPNANFQLIYEAPRSLKSDVNSIPNVARWNNFTKDLNIEKPKTNRYDSLSINLDSNPDEESFCIVMYKTEGSTLFNFAKSFEDLFANDCFTLTTNKFNNLWKPNDPELESLKTLIEVLKSDSNFKINVISGGGIGRRRIPASLNDYKQTNNFTQYQYIAGDTLSFGNDIFRCTQNTATDPDPATPVTGWVKMEIPFAGTFTPGDFIKHNNKLYRANSTVSNATSFVSSEWDELFSYFDPTASYSQGSVVLYNEHLYKALENIRANSPFNYSQWILQPEVEADDDYEFKPPSSGLSTDPWTRVKLEKINRPAAGTLEDIQDSRLRYSYASIIFDPNTYQLNIDIVSYASALFSNLDVNTSISFDGETLITGVNANQFTCLPQPTIYSQNNASQAYITNNPGPIKDSYNNLLSALRVCGLLNAILNRVDLEIFDTQDGATYTALHNKIEAFKNNALTKTTLTEPGPGVALKELTLQTFNKIITNACP